MNKLLILFIFCLSIFSISACMWTKTEHSFRLNKFLIVEFHRAGLIGSLASIYVKDSTNNKTWVGTYNPDEQFIYVHVKNDSLIAEKFQSYPAEYRKELIERKALLIKNKNHIIDN